MPASARSAPSALAAEGSAGTSQSLERGLMILSSFTETRPVLGIADMARAAGLTKSTAYRYVATLAKLGYVVQDPDTKKYSLGPRVIDLGFAALNSMEITRLAAQYLQALSDETGYPASMAVLDGPDIVYVERRRSRRATGFPMDINLHIGSRLPAYCTSMGKVLLAGRSPEQLCAVLDQTEFVRRGPKTIVARKQLASMLALVRQQGIAINDEELAPGLRSVAAPVRDRDGHRGRRDQPRGAPDVMERVGGVGGRADRAAAACQGRRGHLGTARVPRREISGSFEYPEHRIDSLAR